ncbi:MAG: 3-hydroxyacyl-CoA dehydrogenase family protein [Deltaproteobacteria bacterium]|nr:3-hydroxyacyl-CoA dehydrogenase family protein [Deltaproteobacteria bacterium]
MSRSEHIAVVGAGLMGHGIAQVFAARGHEVILYDLNPGVLKEALVKIRTNLEFLSENGLGLREDIEPALERIKAVSTLQEAITGARFVVEAVAENLEIKQALFREMEAYCSPITILATNTSVISITEIAARTRARERVVGTHFWNPPYLVPLVEVVGGRETLPEVKDYTFHLLKSVGKHPVLVKKDVPGFVGNRLQHALWREAISIVEQGIADPETVDDVIKNGFGIRLPVLGPLENADLVGLDLTFQIHDYILKFIENSPAPSPLLRRKLEAGDLGFKTGRGFYTWDQESMGQCRKGLVEHLIRWNVEHQPEEE